MAPTDVAGCRGVIVPEQSLRNALACRKVEVPIAQAERDKCLRDFGIMKESWGNKELIYKDALKDARKRQDLMDRVVLISLSVLSGVLIGAMF